MEVTDPKKPIGLIARTLERRTEELRPKAVNNWGELTGIKDSLRANNTPIIVRFDDGHKRFEQHPNFKPIKAEEQERALLSSLETDLRQLTVDGEEETFSQEKMEDFVSLAVLLQRPNELANLPYNANSGDIAKEVFPRQSFDKDTNGRLLERESWVLPLENIYNRWEKKLYKSDSGFEKFIEDFHSAITREPKGLNENQRRALYGAMNPSSQNAEDIFSKMREGNCDPRVVLITNAVMLALANQYPHQDIFPRP